MIHFMNCSKYDKIKITLHMKMMRYVSVFNYKNCLLRKLHATTLGNETIFLESKSLCIKTLALLNGNKIIRKINPRAYSFYIIKYIFFISLQRFLDTALVLK